MLAAIFKGAYKYLGVTVQTDYKQQTEIKWINENIHYETVKCVIHHQCVEIKIMQYILSIFVSCYILWLWVYFNNTKKEMIKPALCMFPLASEELYLATFPWMLLLVDGCVSFLRIFQTWGYNHGVNYSKSNIVLAFCKLCTFKKWNTFNLLCD